MHEYPSVRTPLFNFGRRMNVARLLVALVGILFPYAARIVGVPAHGLSWLSSYLGGIDAILFLGAFNAISWVSILAATLTYRDVRSVWFPALFGFGVLAYCHVKLDLSSDAQAAIGLIFIPISSLPFVFAGWVVGLFFDRVVFTVSAADAAAESGQFTLRSLLITFVLVGVVCGLFVWKKRRMNARMREELRQAILNGEIDSESARGILGNEVDTLEP